MRNNNAILWALGLVGAGVAAAAIAVSRRPLAKAREEEARVKADLTISENNLAAWMARESEFETTEKKAAWLKNLELSQQETLDLRKLLDAAAADVNRLSK